MVSHDNIYQAWNRESFITHFANLKRVFTPYRYSVKAKYGCFFLQVPLGIFYRRWKPICCHYFKLVTLALYVFPCNVYACSVTVHYSAVSQVLGMEGICHIFPAVKLVSPTKRNQLWQFNFKICILKLSKSMFRLYLFLIFGVYTYGDSWTFT